VLESPENKQAVHNAMNRFIGWMLLVGIVCAILIYLLVQF
jgi:hypothetical protein